MSTSRLLTVRLTDEDHDRLRATAEAKGVTVADLLRGWIAAPPNHDACDRRFDGFVTGLAKELEVPLAPRDTLPERVSAAVTKLAEPAF